MGNESSLNTPDTAGRILRPAKDDQEGLWKWLPGLIRLAALSHELAAQRSGGRAGAYRGACASGHGLCGSSRAAGD